MKKYQPKLNMFNNFYTFEKCKKKQSSENKWERDKVSR